MRIRLTLSTSRDSSRGPWALLRLLLAAHGWTTSDVEEVPGEIPTPSPAKRPDELAQERRLNLEHALEMVRTEHAAYREAIGLFAEAEAAMLEQLREPAAVASSPNELSPLPANVFQVGPCSSAGGRHHFVRVPKTSAGSGGAVLSCSRCGQLGWVGGHLSSGSAVDEEGTLN